METPSEVILSSLNYLKFPTKKFSVLYLDMIAAIAKDLTDAGYSPRTETQVKIDLFSSHLEDYIEFSDDEIVEDKIVENDDEDFIIEDGDDDKIENNEDDIPFEIEDGEDEPPVKLV